MEEGDSIREVYYEVFKEFIKWKYMRYSMPLTLDRFEDGQLEIRPRKGWALIVPFASGFVVSAKGF